MKYLKPFILHNHHFAGNYTVKVRGIGVLDTILSVFDTLLSLYRLP